MKKILFILLAATALFSSCSSDNDVISQDGDNNNSTKKYTVNLNVKSAGFEVDKTPLRAAINKNATILQVRVYEENGEIINNDIFTYKDLNSKVLEDGSLPYSIELPKGNYHVAIIHTAYNTGAEERAISILKNSPKNFFTDTFGAGPLGNYTSFNSANTNSYYQYVKLSLPSNNTDTTKIVLEPMWSTISLKIEDPKEFKVPLNADYITVDVLPVYANFSLSTKFATTQLNSHYTYPLDMDKIDDIRKLDSYIKNFEISQTAPDNNNMKLVIYLYNVASGGLITTVSTQEVDLKTQVQNGLNYKITGKLNNIINVGGGQMSVTFAPFNDNPIDLPFNN